MLKLLIVDGAEDFRSALAQTLKDRYIVRTCSDGEGALAVVRSFLPDIMVLDLAIAGLDGLSLIQIITESREKPVILATTRFISDYVLEASSRIGVDYMMLKPCNTRAVAARLSDMVHSRRPPVISRPDPQVSVSNLLLVLGIGSNRKGYHYLRAAIPLYAKDPSQSMTKELYPDVAKICQSDAKRVERSMRDAIEKAWENRDDQIWKLYFASGSSGEVQKPTNSVFISRLADCLFRERESEDNNGNTLKLQAENMP